MKNQPPKFIDILKVWEKNRILFNVVWIAAALIPVFLPKLNQEGFINNRITHNDTMLFIFGTFIFNFFYTFTWVGTYVIYFIDKEFAWWFTQTFKYPVAFLPLLILIVMLS
jgi:hypothetical protein